MFTVPPRPGADAWNVEPGRNTLFHTMAVLFGIASGSVGLALLVGSFGGFVLGVPLGAVMICFGVALVRLPWRNSGPRLAPRDYEGRLGAGLVLRAHPSPWSVVLALVGVTTFLGLGAGLMLAENEPGTVALLVLLGTPFAIGAYGAVRSRFVKDRGMLVTVDGLVLNTQPRPCRIPWHALRGLGRRWTEMPRTDQVHNWLRFDVDGDLVDGRTWASLLARTPAPVVDIERLAVDPELVVAVIDFYHRHPEEREELNSVVWEDRVGSLARHLDGA